MTTSTITITFSIPEDILNKLKSINNLLSEKYKSKLKTEFISYRPHITIYQIEIPSSNEKEVINQMKKITWESKKIFFQSDTFSIKWNYIAYSFIRSIDIQEFHKKIVESLNPFREWLIKNKYDNLENFTKIEKENILNYWYPYVINAYIPHVTIILLENKEDINNAINEISFNESFFVDTLAVVISKNDINGGSKKDILNLYLNN
jgi:2'-5' RNA ligase